MMTDAESNKNNVIISSSNFELPSVVVEKHESILLKNLLWKLDIRLIPFLSLLYLCSYLDRINIGNAKLAGLEADVHLKPTMYGWCLSIFFVGYVLFEIPSNIILKRIGIKLWIPFTMFIWGTIMILMAFVRSPNHLLIARFFLGVAEAGLFPGVIFYMTLWYTRREQTIRMAIFYSASVISGAFGGILAYGIMQMHNKGNLRGWQWIFIVEGIPTVLLAIAAYFYLPNSPSSAKWLDESERVVLTERLIQDAGSSHDTKFSWRQVLSAFSDYYVYLYALMYISCCTPAYSMSLFLPTIINSMGYTKLSAQGLSAYPYLVTCLFVILNGIHSAKSMERGLHASFGALISIVGFILLLSLPQYGPQATYFASFIACTGTFMSLPPLLSWFTNNIGGLTKRGVAIAFIVSVGNIGGALAGQIYRANDAPFYRRGHSIALGFSCLLFISSLITKCLLIRENKRRENLTQEQYQMETSKTNLADWHPDFRYVH